MVICSFLIPYNSFLPAWVHHDDSFNIKSGEIGRIMVTSGLGNPIRIMLVINGESYIHFYVKDQNEIIIVDENLASGRHSFEVQSGYTFFLDNPGSSIQSVYWITWIYYYEIAFRILGIFLSILCILAYMRWIDLIPQ